MKYITHILAGLLLLTCFSNAQTDSVSSWKHRLVSNLNLTQVTFTDWAQGGENALAWAVSADGRSELDQPTTNWVTNLKVAYGQTRIGGQESRKSDDKIDLESILTYKTTAFVSPYVSATLKSQFAVGYVYTAGVKGDVSKFFDPAYLTQSVGAGYQPITEVKTRLGIGLREVITSRYNQYSDDPKTTDIEKTKIDGGIESSTNVEWKIDDNILFTSKVELFAAFKELDMIILRSDNSIVAQVSKYVTANLNVQLINEKPVTPRTQIKQTLSLGLTYSIL